MAEDFARSFAPYFAWAPPWVFSVVLIAVALALALMLYGLLVRIIRRRLRAENSFWRPLLIRTRGPARLALCLAAISWAIKAAPLPARQTALVQHGLLIAFILLVGWAAMSALDIAAALYLRRYRLDVADNLLARKHFTQVRILRRSLETLLVLLTISFALMTIPGVRQLGVSLLAAGGAAGIILGLALQPLLSNLLAGIQIALTQPIRIDDAVIVEGEWGQVEEITATYVVVRIWDLRRMILPLKYFLEKPFQNWTRQSSELLGAVMLYLDYSTPVDAVRAKVKEIVESQKEWDRKTWVVQVTDFKERTMEIRILASAPSAGQAFDLRCAIRERLVAWLQEAYPRALPRDRMELRPVDVDGEGRSAARAGPGDQRVQ
jgi:small-conductance mechanosensitive channel